jgi:hypothetical protein
VVFHFLLSQFMSVPNTVHVVDTRPTTIADLTVFSANTFQMPLLFFIVGYLRSSSWVRKRSGGSSTQSSISPVELTAMLLRVGWGIMGA